jgi:hypothetical protein
MEMSDVVLDQFVKSIPAHLIVADICNLDDLVTLNLTKSEIEGSATPVEHQDSAAIEFHESPSIVGSRPQVRI